MHQPTATTQITNEKTSRATPYRGTRTLGPLYDLARKLVE